MEGGESQEILIKGGEGGKMGDENQVGKGVSKRGNENGIQPKEECGKSEKVEKKVPSSSISQISVFVIKLLSYNIEDRTHTPG